jgi:hypothetical protein
MVTAPSMPLSRFAGSAEGTVAGFVAASRRAGFVAASRGVAADALWGRDRLSTPVVHAGATR